VQGNIQMEGENEERFLENISEGRLLGSSQGISARGQKDAKAVERKGRRGETSAGEKKHDSLEKQGVCFGKKDLYKKRKAPGRNSEWRRQKKKKRGNYEEKERRRESGGGKLVAGLKGKKKEGRLRRTPCEVEKS